MENNPKQSRFDRKAVLADSLFILSDENKQQMNITILDRSTKKIKKDN
jgi:hypothetical protein